MKLVRDVYALTRKVLPQALAATAGDNCEKLVSGALRLPAFDNDGTVLDGTANIHVSLGNCALAVLGIFVADRAVAESRGEVFVVKDPCVHAEFSAFVENEADILKPGLSGEALVRT